MPITTTVRLRVVCQSGQLTFLISDQVSRDQPANRSVRTETLLCRVSVTDLLRSAGFGGRACARRLGRWRAVGRSERLRLRGPR